MQSTRQARTLR